VVAQHKYDSFGHRFERVVNEVKGGWPFIYDQNIMGQALQPGFFVWMGVRWGGRKEDYTYSS
jgi:hypothetical protein